MLHHMYLFLFLIKKSVFIPLSKLAATECWCQDLIYQYVLNLVLQPYLVFFASFFFLFLNLFISVSLWFVIDGKNGSKW